MSDQDELWLLRKLAVPKPAPVKPTAPEPKTRRPIAERSDQVLVYLHPEGKKQLKLFAVHSGNRVRVHDLMLEAVEEWGAKRGLTGPWRVPSDKPRRS